MSDLFAPIVPAMELERLIGLRRQAAAHLAGEAATKGPIGKSAEALAVLHALASSPRTASDALMLLHELQVYQVELDLQAQELRDSRAELETSLRRHLELYDHQPAGLVTVDARRVVVEINLTAARMFGTARDDAIGLALDAFFSTESTAAFGHVLASLDAGRTEASCRVRMAAPRHPQHSYLASVGKDDGAHRYLLNLMRVDEAEAPCPRTTPSDVR
jgi:PAS domain-containing protein